MSVIIRKFEKKDRETVRTISTATAFLGKSAGIFFSGEEILADALTLYHTDYEPESCFVAEKDKQVIGYLSGCLNIRRQQEIFTFKILPRLLPKALFRGTLGKRKNWLFFCACLRSLFRGEFRGPNYCRQYPGTLHINVAGDFRGLHIGQQLLEHYLLFLRQKQVAGVHCTTISNRAKDFFIREGFRVLYQAKRTYWHHYCGEELTYYTLGKIIS